MNDIDELRDDVRATAPQPRPEFAARLERRVEAGFTPVKAPKQPRQWSLLGPSVALACTVLVAVVVAFAASVDTGGDDAGEGGSSADMLQPTPSAADDEEASGGSARDQPPSAVAPAPPADALERDYAAPGAGGPYTAAQGLEPTPRRARGRGRGGNRVVEQRTALELETSADKFAEVADDVLRVADDTGTIVQRSSVSERDGKGFARYELRVPASRLDEALADLSRLAHVTSRTASSEDITRAYVSATDRLDDARDERRALLKALERADTDIEAEGIRRQIALARSRIAIAERDVAALQRRADRARVTVTVRSTGKRTEGGAWTPGDAVDDAGRILEVATGVVVVTAAALAPVALLALLAGLAARTMRRRRREAALGPR